MRGTWNVHLDPDRTVKLDLNGSFNVVEDKADAPAGETDIKAERFGTITATNVSDGRNVDGMGTGLQVFTPIATCPDWKRDLDPPLGPYCTRDLLSFDIPDLDVGESKEIDISGWKGVDTVKTTEAKIIIDAMLGKSGVVVSADRVWWGDNLNELNPTCKFGDDAEWITYFTEDKNITACSTEPDAK